MVFLKGTMSIVHNIYYKYSANEKQDVTKSSWSSLQGNDFLYNYIGPWEEHTHKSLVFTKFSWKLVLDAFLVSLFWL